MKCTKCNAEIREGATPLHVLVRKSVAAKPGECAGGTPVTETERRKPPRGWRRRQREEKTAEAAREAEAPAKEEKAADAAQEASAGSGE